MTWLVVDKNKKGDLYYFIFIDAQKYSMARSKIESRVPIGSLEKITRKTQNNLLINYLSFKLFLRLPLLRYNIKSLNEKM